MELEIAVPGDYSFRLRSLKQERDRDAARQLFSHLLVDEGEVRKAKSARDASALGLGTWRRVLHDLL